LSPGPVLKVPLDGLQDGAPPTAATKIETMEEAERRHIIDALEATNWVVGGPKGAAALLGMKRTTLQWRIEKLGINLGIKLGDRASADKAR
jgi:formate hydrogenlyase transcriptional activator